MKTFQLAVVLLIVCISSSLALKCNRCVPMTVGGSCFTTVETCQRSDEVCARVIATFPRYSYFKRCMKKLDAFSLQAMPNFNVFTCSSDRCN